MQENVFTKAWWKAAIIRSVRTIAQSAVSLIAVGVPVFDIDWKMVIAVSVTAGICSLLTSIAGLPEVQDER